MPAARPKTSTTTRIAYSDTPATVRPTASATPTATIAVWTATKFLVLTCAVYPAVGGPSPGAIRSSGSPRNLDAQWPAHRVTNNRASRCTWRGECPGLWREPCAARATGESAYPLGDLDAERGTA